ncbi:MULTISPECIES: hypothetical protein [Amycolatopsis]|uniref:Uncharacterized protein n=1 Tax=Amycolatopsis bullii TaxID=941987 RepID=A0ABQ3KNK6_9PSEU|nr:hypothetical protein [Amycolatopsis bullii]GHG41181.1 hypothetical protein GCM10017567_73340 [Amycolatopsis bullii]
MDWDPSDTDFIRIPRPRSVARVLLDVVRLRTARAMARERNDAINAVAQVMIRSGGNARVVSRDPAGDWSITVGAVPALPAEHT